MGTLDSTNTDTTNSDADFDFSEDQLRLAAQALDNGEVADLSFGDGLVGPSSGETEEVNKQSTNNAEHVEAQNGAGESADNKADESADKDSKPDSESAEPKESNYAKAKKNAERFDRNWRRLQEQQQELAKQRAELAAREAALRSQSTPAQSTQPTQQQVTQAGHSPERYEEAALEWEREGKFDLAELARAQARLLKSSPQAAAPAAVQQQTGQPVQSANADGPGSPKFIQTWNENLRALEADADFADLRNRDSALYKATAGVLQEDARLSYFSDGIRLAARIAKLRVEAGAVPELQAKVQAYEQELAKLRAATSPSRGTPNSRGSAKAFEELSMAEQERELIRLAQEVDGA